MILLDNAIKYTAPEGEITVSCRKVNENYEIKFQNTGEQIPKESQTRIFEQFYRTDKARSRSNMKNGSGAGLGLSIGYWIAEAHSGRLELLYSKDSETAFNLILPISSKT